MASIMGHDRQSNFQVLSLFDCVCLVGGVRVPSLFLVTHVFIAKLQRSTWVVSPFFSIPSTCFIYIYNSRIGLVSKF